MGRKAERKALDVRRQQTGQYIESSQQRDDRYKWNMYFVFIHECVHVWIGPIGSVSKEGTFLFRVSEAIISEYLFFFLSFPVIPSTTT